MRVPCLRNRRGPCLRLHVRDLDTYADADADANALHGWRYRSWILDNALLFVSGLIVDASGLNSRERSRRALHWWLTSDLTEPDVCCGLHGPDANWLARSFDAAVSGTTYVFHTASPFVLTVPRGAAREVLVEPAIKGTENIIGACRLPGRRL